MNPFMYIINSITPQQTENERDFSLAGIYTALRRFNPSLKMISGLLLINRNITSSGHNTPIGDFGVSIYAMDDTVDDMERNPDASVGSSDTE